MRAIIAVPVSKITYKKQFPRTKAIKFALQLLRGAMFPPIHLRRNADGTFTVCDGRNRLIAHRLARKETIKAHVAIPQEPFPYKELTHNGTEGTPAFKRERLKLSPTPKE